MHRHAVARRYWSWAILDKVSPFCTMTLSRKVTREEAFSGKTIAVPTGIRLGSITLGFAASNSCQREPRPRCCTARLQRLSPGCTITFCTGTFCTGVTKGAATGAGAGALGTGTISVAVGGLNVRRNTLNRGGTGAGSGADGTMNGAGGAEIALWSGASGLGAGAIPDTIGAVKVGRSMLNRGAAGATLGVEAAMEGAGAAEIVMCGLAGAGVAIEVAGCAKLGLLSSRGAAGMAFGVDGAAEGAGAAGVAVRGLAGRGVATEIDGAKSGRELLSRGADGATVGAAAVGDGAGGAEIVTCGLIGEGVTTEADGAKLG